MVRAKLGSRLCRACSLSRGCKCGCRNCCDTQEHVTIEACEGAQESDEEDIAINYLSLTGDDRRRNICRCRHGQRRCLAVAYGDGVTLCYRCDGGCVCRCRSCDPRRPQHTEPAETTDEHIEPEGVRIPIGQELDMEAVIAEEIDTRTSDERLVANPMANYRIIDMLAVHNDWER